MKLLTYKQTADLYGVTPRTVRRWAEKGAVVVTKTPGGRPRVIEADTSGQTGNNRIAEESDTTHS